MLAPWKKSYDKPRHHVKKHRHYFADKGPYSQRYSFSSSHVWIWELDHKESLPKNWCFWTVVLEKTLESPLDARRSTQSILKEITPEYSLEGLMLKLKLQYFGYLMGRTDSWKEFWCWEKLKAGGEGDDRGCDGWMASPTRWSWVWVDSRSWWWTGRPGVMWFMGWQRVGHDCATELNWKIWMQHFFFIFNIKLRNGIVNMPDIQLPKLKPQKARKIAQDSSASSLPTLIPSYNSD